MKYNNSSFTFKDVIELKQELNTLTKKYKYNKNSTSPDSGHLDPAQSKKKKKIKIFRKKINILFIQFY
jgi:hypothetical protein